MNSKLHPDDIQLMLKEGSPSFKILSGKSIFITGGTGFFGKWLLEGFQAANRLQNLNISISVLSRDPSNFIKMHPYLSEGIEFIKGDIKSFQFPKRKFDYIIHAATEASATLNANEPDKMLDDIIEGGKRILEFARTNGVKNILHTSSGAVYGTQPTDIDLMPENSLLAPATTQTTSAYGEGKRVVELLGRIYNQKYGINFLNARCYAFAGPYLPLDGTYAIGNFVADVLANRPIHMTGDGTPRRSYLYGADLVVWLLKILTHGKTNINFHIGSEHWYSIRDIANLVLKTAKKPALESNLNSTPSNLSARYVPSTKKTREELQLKEFTSLDVAIKRMLEYQR